MRGNMGNSSMPIEAMGMMCCAGIELDGLQERYHDGGIDLVLADIAQQLLEPGFLIFTNATTFTSGRALARAIRRLKLGTVTEVDAGPNPATSNPIRVWIWAVDHRAYRAYRRTNHTKHLNLVNRY